MTDVITIPYTFVAFDEAGGEAFTVPGKLDLHIELRPASNDPDGPMERFVESCTLRIAGLEVPRKFAADWLQARLREWEQENEDLDELNRDIWHRLGVRVEGLV